VVKLTDIAWSQRTMASLQDGGVWGVPRSALIFTKRGNALVLTAAMPHHDALPMDADDWKEFQDDDFAAIKLVFEAAGFEVTDARP
jgi:hypothetical protein